MGFKYLVAVLFIIIIIIIIIMNKSIREVQIKVTFETHYYTIEVKKTERSKL